MYDKKLKSNVKQIQMICDYIAKECVHDLHLAERVMLENKTLDGMYKYIMTAVKNKFKDQIVDNGVCVAEEDVYNLAIHYFIEDDETLNKEYPVKVTKEEIKKNTVNPITNIEKDKNGVYQLIRKPVKPEKQETGQMSLFDFGDGE